MFGRQYDPLMTLRRLAALAVFALAAACSTPTSPLTVEEGFVNLENRTDREWRNVRIVVNDHFHGGVPTLAAGGRLNAPLSQFQTGYQQKFDRGRMSVQKIEVTATDSAGETVTMKWPEILTEGQ